MFSTALISCTLFVTNRGSIFLSRSQVCTHLLSGQRNVIRGGFPKTPSVDLIARAPISAADSSNFGIVMGFIGVTLDFPMRNFIDIFPFRFSFMCTTIAYPI